MDASMCMGALALIFTTWSIYDASYQQFKYEERQILLSTVTYSIRSL